MLFHALTLAGSQGCCLNIRLLRRVVKHHMRDTASFNAMKQTYVIAVIQISPDLNLNWSENIA